MSICFFGSAKNKVARLQLNPSISIFSDPKKETLLFASTAFFNHCINQSLTYIVLYQIAMHQHASRNQHQSLQPSDNGWHHHPCHHCPYLPPSVLLIVAAVPASQCCYFHQWIPPVAAIFAAVVADVVTNHSKKNHNQPIYVTAVHF